MQEEVSAYETPYIPLGPFKFRLPFIHYRVETSEFLQGLIIGTTALSSLYFLTEHLGISEELAWSCIIFEVSLYLLHGMLGDPVIPGWITPAVPLVLVYLKTFELGAERIQALIALQLTVALVFLFMAVTNLATTFIKYIPTAMKGGILLATPISVMQIQLSDSGSLMKYPISVGIGFLSLCIICFSPFYRRLRRFRVLDVIAKYGNLFPYLVAMFIGVIIAELPTPKVELGSVVKIPDFAAIIDQVSVFGVGLPRFDMFVSAAPLALVAYVIAFGDFVTTETLVEEAQRTRNDEHIDFNPTRSNLISGMRNLALSVVSPYPPLAGPLWVGMTVSVTTRYAEGKEAMASLIGAMASFRIGTLISVMLVPVVTFMWPIFPVGAAITLLFQAFVCVRIGMEYCRSDLDKSIAGIMAVVLAFQGSFWGLAAGLFMCFLFSDFLWVKECYRRLRDKSR